jgi:ribosomal protein L11 methyltransferase
VFGDGGHPTTGLALEALAAEIDRRGVARVLDVGTGTGVLAAAALARGAAVVALDRDPAAVEAARRRAPGARVLLGEAPGAIRPDLAAFDVVVANIAEPELRGLVPALAGALSPTGTLIVTGALLWQAAALARALDGARLEPGSPVARLGWCLYVATPAGG